MEKVKFAKMNGLGNDFIILDYDEYEKTKMPPDKLAIKLCDRKFGIGADGLIIVSEKTARADISWIFYNSDGSVAEMCGNGMRCFARYVYDKKIIDKKEFTVETKAGIKIPKIVAENEVRVNMGMPILEPKEIPIASISNANVYKTSDGNEFKLYAISMGNPHCIVFVKEHSKDFAFKYGPIIEVDRLFPAKTNVEFVEIVSRNEVIVNVWERGCGITLACGTGACATTVAGILNGYLDNDVKVNLPGGQLRIEWQCSKDKLNECVFMTGRADYSFIGEINII